MTANVQGNGRAKEKKKGSSGTFKVGFHVTRVNSRMTGG